MVEWIRVAKSFLVSDIEVNDYNKKIKACGCGITVKTWGCYGKGTRYRSVLVGFSAKFGLILLRDRIWCDRPFRGPTTPLQSYKPSQNLTLSFNFTICKTKLYISFRSLAIASE